MQKGGCHPTDGCKGAQPFKGASFKYLAASTFNTRTGQTIFPPYYVKRFEGIPVAFIGLTLKDTPNIVVPSGVAGLRFDDEAETVNRLVPELQRQGIGAIVVLIHEGGSRAATTTNARASRAPSSTSSRSSTRRSTWSSAAIRTRPTTAASTAGW